MKVLRLPIFFALFFGSWVLLCPIFQVLSTFWFLICLASALGAAWLLGQTITIVPEQSACIVERLGKYRETLFAGFHLMIPFVDRIAYRQSLKEVVVDIPEQTCITRDNVELKVDGVIYLQVREPEKASYGIENFRHAISELSQATLRSEIGRIDLDHTFAERAHLNRAIVAQLDEASAPWGVKVLRVEIQNITPPRDLAAAMEKQMRAEREKRATILVSEGEREAAINLAEGEKQKVIKASEAAEQRQINEAAGEAQAILKISAATAEGIKQISESVASEQGLRAAELRIADNYVQQFGQLARANATVIVPADVSNIASFIASGAGVLRGLG